MQLEACEIHSMCLGDKMTIGLDVSIQAQGKTSQLWKCFECQQNILHVLCLKVIVHCLLLKVNTHAELSLSVKQIVYSMASLIVNRGCSYILVNLRTCALWLQSLHYTELPFLISFEWFHLWLHQCVTSITAFNLWDIYCLPAGLTVCYVWCLVCGWFMSLAGGPL